MLSRSPPPTHPETIVLHAGWRADPQTGSVAGPIHRLSVAFFLRARHDAQAPLLALPPELAAQAPGPAGDPDVAARHHAAPTEACAA